MKTNQETLKQFLLDNKKKEAILFAIDGIKQNAFTIVELYEQLITPILFDIGQDVLAKRLSIWQEHVCSAIIRSMIESCYVYLDRMLPNHQKAMVFCPNDELHEIGARMVSDYFDMLGFETFFVGSNTPKDDVYQAIDIEKPSIIAISVSNYYHLTSMKEMIETIKQTMPQTKIVAGGSVFVNRPELATSFGADGYAYSFDSLKELITCFHLK